MLCNASHEAVDDAWVAAAQSHRQSNFPQFIAKSSAELLSSMNVALTHISDARGIMRGDVFKIAMVNTSFLGPESARLRADLKGVLVSWCMQDELRTCCIVVAPVVGEHGTAYSDDSIEKAGRDWLDDLRDDTGLIVKPVTIMFDSATMWSETRGLTHLVYLCISKKLDATGKLACAFAKSSMFVRGAVADIVKVLPRHELVNPVSRIATGDKNNLSKERERKQWVTGPSLMSALAESLWSGMSLHAKHLAIWFDVVPYDGHLPMSCIVRSGVQVTKQPTECCASVVWAQSGADNKAIDSIVEKRVMATLREQCAKSVYSIEGAPDLAKAAATMLPGQKKSPTYNESDFKLTKPMADQSLPFRKTFADKWLAPNVPASLQDEFRAMQVKHDTDFNKSAILWEGDSTKRKADRPASGEDAATLVQAEDCPKTRPDIQAKHGDIKLKQMTGWNLLVCEDGAMFAEGGESVQVVLVSEPLAFSSGEWLVGTEYEKAKKSGASGRV